MANTLREMQTKTTIRYHLTLVRMAIIKNSKIINAGEGVGFPGCSTGKETAYSVGDLGLIPGVAKIPWRRKWPPTPVFCPGEFHGLYSLWSRLYRVYGEGVNKGSFYTVGGNVNWCSQYAEQYGDSLKH